MRDDPEGSRTASRSAPAATHRWLILDGRAGALVVLLMLSLLLVPGCSGRGEGAEIDLSAGPPDTPPPLSVAPPKDRLVLAVAAVNSPLSTFEAYADLAGYLAERLDLDARFVGGKTYAEINSLVRSGDATLAMVCTGAYVYGHDEFGMELLAAPVINGHTVYYSYLIAHQDSPINSWQQLRGRTFAFSDPLSNSGRLVPLYQIWLMGQTPESLFSKYIFTYSHDNSIKAVAGRLVDAASVDSLVYDYALSHGEDDAWKTRIVWRSPPYAINPVVVNPNLDSTLKARLMGLLLQMDNNEQGRQILGRLQFERFTAIDDSAYASSRAMARAVGFSGAP
ncbi:MAG: phosphate/phosphite/phosphonate ABC transporter substrate-binding protein [Chloroflexi bacterium]|nr:phosphate/phosphite/phosphonate ABC transporter substrate-binding protein [Chloroflexota bacterium]